MSRSVELWVGDNDDQAIPARVKLRVWERCGGCCAITGRKLRPGDRWQVDHIIALACGWVGFMLTAAVHPAPGFGGHLWVFTSVALFVMTLPIEDTADRQPSPRDTEKSSPPVTP